MSVKNFMSLDELYISESAEIVCIDTTSEIFKRLRDMGIREENIIEMLHYDPVVSKKCVVKIAECQIAFDFQLAKFIKVRPIKSWYIFYKEQAFSDSLTGCFNRNSAFIALAEAYDKAQENKYPMSIILIDIDNFKKINDTFGHDVGDRVLAEVGSFLRKNVRRTDMVFRWGGDEFLILMRGLSFKEAFIIANRICSCAEYLEFKPFGKSLITLSAGVDGVPPYLGIEKLLERCDKALYFAKNKGKNQACIFFLEENYDFFS